VIEVPCQPCKCLVVLGSIGETSIIGSLSNQDESVDGDERRRVRSGSRTSSTWEKQMFKQARLSLSPK